MSIKILTLNRKSVTPRTPHLFNYFLHILVMCTLLLCLNRFSYAQDLESLDSLRSSLKEYYNRSWTADREQFIFSSRGEIWAKLPNVGIQFGLPSVQFGTKDIYNIKQSKREKKAALKSLDLKYRTVFNEAIQNLEIDYKKIQLKLEKLEFQKQSVELEEKIFSIYSEAFGKRELTPLEFLQKKKAYSDVLANYEIEKREIELQILELYKFARWRMKNEELAYLDTEGTHKLR